MSEAGKDEQCKGGVHHYCAFGLHIRSDLILPELAIWGVAGPSAPLIVIRLDEVKAGMSWSDATDSARLNGPDQFVFEVKNTARYRVRNGNEIDIAAVPGSSPRNIRLFLLGSAFGALCHQRGLLPLHASAIEVNSRCVAFAGPSGSGKSTLAAHFHDRGYRVLSDDVCVVSFDGDGRPLAWPGVPRLKLWRDAAHALERDVGIDERDFDGTEKYQFPAERQVRGPLPFDRLYVLQEAGHPPQFGIDRMTGAGTVDAFLAHTYRRHMLAPLGRTKDNFVQCATLAKHAAVFSTGRTWGFDIFAAQTALLERHMSKIRQ